MPKVKVVLGLNGWPYRSHDAAAALVVDGKPVAMVEEERLSREKHAFDSLPLRAVAWCLVDQGLALSDVDEVAVGWDYPALYRLRKLRTPWHKSVGPFLFPEKFFPTKRYPLVTFVDHHRAHAAAAYFASGFDDAAVLVVDGQGESSSATLYDARGTTLKKILAIPIRDSLGLFYESACSWLGLGNHNAGKLMGLAPYGDASRFSWRPFALTAQGIRARCRSTIKLGDSGLDEQAQLHAMWSEYFQSQGSTPKHPTIILQNHDVWFDRRLVFNQADKDFAAAVQLALEEVVLHLTKIARQRIKSPNFCVTGGTALNCSVNKRIVDAELFKNHYFFPAANDAGVAFGAAMAVSGSLLQRQINHADWGPEYSSSYIAAYLRSRKIPFRRLVRRGEMERHAARRLAAGQVIGWFQGQAEIGPRALGHRSILADPRNRRNHARVNALKGREQWRPLAPSVLAGRESEYFTPAVKSPFMLMTATVRPATRRKIPAVTHVDGTARYQSVERHINPRYYRLIEEFERLTGVPMVLNTSFNRFDEPIVCSPEDALRTFVTTPLDVLVMEDTIIEKRK